AGLAAELNLGLDSFIFVDDNPKECAEVSSGAPEVLSVALPAAAEEIPHFLQHVWAFDRAGVTKEDRIRSASYGQSRGFGAEMRSTESLEQFMAGLRLEVRIEPLTAAALPRIAQLTQRTNQFNFTTIRRSEAEIESLSCEGFAVHVADRFAEYGLTGAVFVTR